MALVECKHCGKKVSDTLDKCFFCNNSLKNEVEIKPKDTNKKYIKFSSLSIEDSMKLEKEFANSSDKTIKYMQKSTAPKRFFTTFAIALIYFILFYAFGLIVVEKLEIIQVYNEKLFVTSLVLAFSALLLITVIIISAVIIKIINDVSINNYIYLKKFQTWLKEEKNILFSTDFLSAKEKEKFKQIDLESMDL